MPLWTLFGLQQGQATTTWNGVAGDDGQAGVLGMPRIDPAACIADCHACADACPTEAIRVDTATRGPHVKVDYGRCIVCQLCVEACPTGAAATSGDWAFGVRDREDLVLAERAQGYRSGASDNRRVFRRSLHVRHVDAGSCNGCESELQALNNPFYNLHRFGIFFTPSPRFADLLLVTGPVTQAMHEPLRRAYEAMPEPKWVMASGTCAVSGGIVAGGPCGHGLEGVLPVDLYLPGCPPNPAAVAEALLTFLNRVPQRVHGGRIAD